MAAIKRGHCVTSVVYQHINETPRIKYSTDTKPTPDARIDVFTAVNIQLKVFWVVTPYTVVVGY